MRFRLRELSSHEKRLYTWREVMWPVAVHPVPTSEKVRAPWERSVRSCGTSVRGGCARVVTAIEEDCATKLHGWKAQMLIPMESQKKDLKHTMHRMMPGHGISPRNPTTNPSKPKHPGPYEPNKTRQHSENGRLKLPRHPYWGRKPIPGQLAEPKRRWRRHTKHHTPRGMTSNRRRIHPPTGMVENQVRGSNGTRPTGNPPYKGCKPQDPPAGSRKKDAGKLPEMPSHTPRSASRQNRLLHKGRMVVPILRRKRLPPPLHQKGRRRTTHSDRRA